MNKIYLTVALILLPIILFAQDWKVNSNYWVATDALGRKTPVQSEVGPARSGKYVAIFYWTWHTDNFAEFSPVMNISEILKEFPEAANDANHPAWKGIWNEPFWWDEPLFGYYRTTDEWVLRKHAEMLADAGIDAVFFDCTNGSFTWKSSYTKLLKVWDQARKDGVKTPQIAFMLPFSATSGALISIMELYNDLYRPNLYRDLWFMWKGKPIIMAYPEMLVSRKGDTAAQKFTAASAFSAVEAKCPSWNNNIGNLTFKLYKWFINYNSTIARTSLAETTFVNFSDNQRLVLQFATQQPGEYLWELSNGTETVGVWKFSEDTPSVTSYFNGHEVSGDYESRIFYTSDSAFHNLTNGSYASIVPVQIGQGIDAALMDSIRNFFTFRPGQPDYVNGPSRTDQWGWLENYPQHGYVRLPGGGYEQVTVGIGQNANDASGGHAYAFNAPGTYGRSYTQTHGQDPRPDAYLYGLNFAEQWSRAFELDPQLVFVTGWNEWIAGRDSNWPPSNPYKPFAFPDEYNWDKSRDIEPVKSWGDKGDVYYIQLVNNVRRFKGMKKQEPASAEKTIHIGAFDGWRDVKPEYWDYKGDTMHRAHKGQGDQLVYTNTSGRNDIQLAKVARDDESIYFYVETVDELTPKTDPKWMRLFIDIDRDKATGWEGYDFVINRSNPGDSALIEKSTDGWNWEKVGSAAYAVQGNKLELKVARSILGLAGEDDLDFEFKWSDNMLEDGNIMDFYVNGDVAPSGRFNYVYQTKDVTGINENIGETPKRFSLLQNYPNPFNPVTTIYYQLPTSGKVTLQVFDVHGQLVKTLFKGRQSTGLHRAAFNAQGLASGVYFCRLAMAGLRETQKMTLVR